MARISGEKGKRSGKRSRGRLLGLLLCILSVAIVAVNLALMLNSAGRQSDELGSARLQKISNQVQKTLDDSKIMLLRFASDVEVFIDRGSDLKELQSYLKSQSRIFRDQSENTFMNAFICTSNWMLISDSPRPENYVVTERDWYRTTLRNGIDNITISAPYVDAFTGGMCFTATLLLSNGRTIVGLDFNLTRIQEFIAEMNGEGNGEALIVSRDGIIVGYTDNSLAGERIDDALAEYADVFERLLNERIDDTAVETEIAGQMSKVFCNRSGEWLLLYRTDSKTAFQQDDRWLRIGAALIVLLGGVLGLFLYPDRAGGEAEPREPREKDKLLTLTKGIRNGIMAVMLVTGVVAIAFTGIVLVNWGKDRMEREVDSYNYQLKNWTDTQLQTMNMFVDTIAANPAVLDDYDFAVEYLDKIVRHYPHISAAYIARPGSEHEMTMNNGWVPNADYAVAERQWYIDTINSPSGINISAPYLDARTGLYCVTFSRIVHVTGTKLLGVFALDFYIGNLTKIMESSYSSNGYAFLVDNSSVIVNHPNANYQISGERSTNITGTEYDGLLDNSSIHFIFDYDGRFKACISRTEDITGFTVVSVKDAANVYGVVLLSGMVFITLLVVCIVLLYQLIMRMIRWQDQVRQTLTEEADRASRADRAKSSFLAQMSHEIRTPINAVLGMNEMILRESSEANVLEYASNAYNAGKALLSIINDILDISKIEAGKLEIVETDYELYSLVNDCYNLTADRAERKGLRFLYQIDESLPSRLSGDMFHIRQIVVNLITNAIKYTDEGSVELLISGENSEEGFRLRIRVRDTGIGLTEESMGKLFASFQRFDLKRNQAVEGTGLGLSICRQLAELMGGTISAESVYGQGSTFGLTVPQRIVDPEPVGAVSPGRSSGPLRLETERAFTARGARILVVDDVEMNLIVFTSLLKKHRLTIDTARSGRECLEKVREQRYDMIFMDHMMPEMDGVETYREMRRTEHLSRGAPVVMLTANAISGERDKYLAEGFVSYLTKPIQSDKLEETLLDYLPEDKIEWQKRTQKASASPARGVAEGTELLDVKLGLSYNADSENVYLTVLESYVKSGAETMPNLRRCCMEEDWSGYIIEVHALKSISLTIGAKQLSEAAKELELAGKAENYELIRRKNDALLELYGKVLREGADYLAAHAPPREEAGEADAGDAPEIGVEAVAERVEKIKAACLEYDGGKVSAICEEAGAYSCRGILLRPLFDGVKASAEDFECDEAAEKAQAILDGIMKSEESKGGAFTAEQRNDTGNDG